MKIMSFLGQSS